jgi:uncharacterized protein YbcC (UPF0753/DUF2309 family)
VKFFDAENLPDKDQASFERFVLAIEKTRAKNAQERCRRFVSVDLKVSAKKALKEVKHRASAIFEPRPELNHANNSLCIVGRRELTSELFFDRRAFLNSYDPTVDSSGRILNSILNAVIPVCGGINLEYYFSKVDNLSYGCGTKLSHNVCGLLGVINGIDDDLRPGLPEQMIEIHDPVRLLTIIEQSPEIVKKLIQENTTIRDWIQNSWVKIACIDPNSGNVFLYDPKNGFEEFKSFGKTLPVVSSIDELIHRSRDNISVSRIIKAEKVK